MIEDFDTSRNRMTVTKIDAARHQIETSIKLLFEDTDPISVHTLACAARVILQDLSKQRQTNYWTAVNSGIPENKRTQLWRDINRAANFLKHADRDPDAILTRVEEEANDHMLYICTQMYRSLGQEVTPTMTLFLAWHAGVYPNMWKEIPKKRVIGMIAETLYTDLQHLPRQEQLQRGRGFLTPREQRSGFAAGIGAYVSRVLNRLTAKARSLR